MAAVTGKNGNFSTIARTRSMPGADLAAPLVPAKVFVQTAFFNFDKKCLRNFATLGATTYAQ